MPRATSIISPIARSATQSFSTSGVLPTGMLRAAAAFRSILSTPTPKLEITFSLGSASINAASAKPDVASPVNSAPRCDRNAFGSGSSTRRCRSNASASCFSRLGISRPYCRTRGFIIEWRRTRRASCMTSYEPSRRCRLVPVARGGRLATAPLAAVGQVRAHRRARTVGVSGRDGAQNTLVLGVHLQQVGAPLGLGHARAFARARDDGLAEHADDLREVRVARGARDAEVKTVVGVDRLAAGAHRALELVERLAQHGQVADRKSV